MNKKVLQRIPSSLTEEEVKTIINDEIDLENADLNTWTKEDFVTFGNQANQELPVAKGKSFSAGDGKYQDHSQTLAVRHQE